MITVLALDLGIQCGWATSTKGRIESGVQVFDLKRGESPGMRFLRWRRWIEEMPKVDLYAYEQTHNRGGAATEISAGFATRVQEHAAQVGANHIALHSATLKKWATGDGRAGKPEMIAAVQRRWGHTHVIDDNESDALCLLHYAMEHYG